jgi:type IX secretion system PorP/SprF family membrane protein
VPFELPGNLGLGLLLNSDVAGDGNFGTLQIKFSAAYHQLNLLDSTLNLSMGINAAYNQHTLDFHRLYFDSQYNGVQFDPNSQTNENYSSESFNFFDFSLGFKVSYLLNDKLPLNFGIVFNHLNRPKQSFFEEEVNRLEGKFNSYLSADVPLSKYWIARPMVYYYRQGEFNELFYGFLLEKELNHLTFRSLNFGLINRNSDALIFRLGLNYQSFDIGFSYDLNYSSLKVASNGVGAFELSVIYLMHNPKRYEPMFNRQCPVFM